MSKYLIEIGTEELPYSFIPSAQKQLKELLEKSLKENRIDFKNIETHGTPRRLVAIVEDITTKQPDLEKVIKGPLAKICFDDSNNPTKAAEGFVKKQGITLDDTYKEDQGGVEYLFAKIEEKGKTIDEILPIIIPEVIFKIQGSHFMRWADFDIKFSRPIRWIVSLLDNEEIKINIGEIESSRISRGHRFHTEKEVEISNPDKYMEELKQAKVIVDKKERELAVVSSAQEIAKTIDAKVELDPELVKEVTNIVEWPVPVLSSFDKKYLDIPDDVTVTVMASHQRYFPVYAQDGKLLNNFITMANYIGDEFENIQKGNERVISARLEDAIFFYNEDNKKPLVDKVDALKGVTFQQGLGTVYDKTQRIKLVASSLADQLSLDDKKIQNIERTALLCKADLTTNLVFEFTELQGYIGCDYAKVSGENDLVAEGIKEHYFPVSADSELANTITGQVVGIADKIDTICGVFSIGKIPTGSADPLGLRRAALGTMITILNKGLQINLTDAINYSISQLPNNIENKQELTEKIREFFIQRLKVYLNDTYRHDIIDAALEVNDPLSNLTDLKERVEILTSLTAKENYSSFHESANRISRLIKEADYKSSPDSNLFVQEIEGQLWNCTKALIDNNLNYNELVAKLEQSIPVIEKFFDDVLVMDKDESIKENRISILGNLKAQFQKIGDFSKIVA